MLEKSDIKQIGELIDKKFDDKIESFALIVQKGFLAMDEKIDNLSKEMRDRFAQIDKRFEEMDLRFDAIDARFDQLEERTEKLEINVIEILTRLDNIETKVDRMEADIVDIRDRLAGIEKRLLAMKERVDALVEKYSKYSIIQKKDINLALDGLKSLKQKVAALESKIKKIQTAA